MVFHGGKTRSLGWLKPRFPRGTNRLFTEGNFPQLVRSIQGALESSFHSKTMTRERLVSFTRPVFWLTVPADKKRLQSSLSMTAMEKKKRILAHLFIPWAFKDRTRHFLPLILDRRGEEWKNAFDRRRSYLMYIRWSRKGNHDDTGNPLRFWGRCSIVWYIGYGGRKKNSFPHNFNTVFVVMGEGGIPQTPPVFLLLKEFIFWEWSMIMPRFIFIRNSIFFLRLYSLLWMIDFRNFNEIIFCFYVLFTFLLFVVFFP